jgi:hypothetical protein
LEREKQLDELLARDGIRDLVARYNSYGDSGRFAPLFELFASDAVMETGDLGGEFTRYEGLEEVTKIFTGAQDRIRSRPDSSTPGYIRHFTATHQIDLIDADHAAGRTTPSSWPTGSTIGAVTSTSTSGWTVDGSSPTARCTSTAETRAAGSPGWPRNSPDLDRGRPVSLRDSSRTKGQVARRRLSRKLPSN